MKKNSFFTLGNLKFILVLTIFLPLRSIFPSEAAGQTDESGIYIAVDEMPTFPGGLAELGKYLGKNIHYPVAAKENGIQGKVIVKFCVTAQGSLTKFSVLKSVDPDLDKEALRVVQTITSFTPGKKDGVPVPVWYMVPITFSIKNTN